MNCKKCKYSHTEVVYTRKNDNLREIQRRRQCLKCGLRFTTVEKMKEPVLKK